MSSFDPIRPVKIREELPPEKVADWLVSVAGERWSKAYHHGVAIWHRVLRSERFATILLDHNVGCQCEMDIPHPVIMWGGGAHSPIAEKYLETGSYGLWEPSEYISNLSSPA